MGGGWKSKKCADLTPQEWEKKRTYERKRWKRWSSEKRQQHSAQYVVWYRKNHKKAVQQSYLRMLKHLYHLSPVEYDRAHANQHGRCGMCFLVPVAKKRRALVVDHNHRTNKFRSLLCRRCNTFVGYMETNPSLVKQAATYLAQYAE